MAPRPPEGPLQRLPPILRSHKPSSIPGYSKGPRGLSVLLRGRGIFTATSISPSLWLRQRSSRYAVHARRNLPDKELRYLRTVIVTAAVYRGFGRQLPLSRHRLPQPTDPEQASDPIRPLASWQGPVFLVNSRRSRSSAALPEESAPSTEGTGPFCRVPSRGFSRTPSDPHLAHLCRFAVRADGSSGRGFSRPTVQGLPAKPSPLRDGGVYHPDPLRVGVTRHQPHHRVREYSPAAHRLRSSASS